MKVCILSMQRINNMGSLLQSYALKTTVEKLGHEVEFLDIIKRDEDYNLRGDCENKYCTEKEKQGLVGKVKKIDRYALNRLKIKRQSLKQDAVFELFRKESLAIEKRRPQYDVCIIGSDEVFNCLSAGAWGFTSQLFGNVAEAEKVITYAASCGSTEYEKLPVKVADRIRQSFANVAAFSVRDGNTYSFVSNLSDKRVTENLDPVLVYAFDREIEDACLPKLPEHYCVVYSYYNRIHTAEEITAIKDFCQRHQLTPVAVGAPQFWIKDYIVCSPFQCLKVFKHADFIITDTFHGTIFSAKYAKKFAVITRPSNENKLCDLINKLGIEEHRLRSFMQLSQVYQVEKKTDRINSLLAQEQINTLRYLKENIV